MTGTERRRGSLLGVVLWLGILVLQLVAVVEADGTVERVWRGGLLLMALAGVTYYLGLHLGRGDRGQSDA